MLVKEGVTKTNGILTIHFKDYCQSSDGFIDFF